MTFTVDEETAATLRRTASRLKKPQSVIVREAIQDYASRAARLGHAERKRMLLALDRAVARPSERTQADVDEEIAEIRRLRRTGGRGTPAR